MEPKGAEPARRVAEKVERAKFVVGRRLKDARLAKQYSQVRLAGTATVSLRCVQKVEAGDVFPDIYTLYKLGEVLDFTPEEMLKNL